MSESVTVAIVKGTFALLLFGSVVTWGLVLVKARQRWLARSRDGRFRAAVGTPLKLAAVRGDAGADGPASRVVQAGLAALSGRAEATEPREELQRALEAQIHKERRTAESGLAVLASIGTTSPFVGLFGTVLGIITALRAIGHSGSASLEVVAAPIGEALVATAVGIAVAVPAVLAYNFFLRRLKVQGADLEQLAAELLGAAAAARFRAPAPAGELPLRGKLPGTVPFEGREASV
jgi:biopolymer transport protein ExbB